MLKYLIIAVATVGSGALLIHGCSEARADEWVPIEDTFEDVTEQMEGISARMDASIHQKCLLGSWQCGAYLNHCVSTNQTHYEYCIRMSHLCREIFERCLP